VKPAPVRSAPFPHTLADDWLEPGLYAELAGAFPDCPSASGPTGYTLFRGDPEYDSLVAGHPAWRLLFDRFHSQAFIDHVLDQFRSEIRAGCRFDLSAARYVDYVESRADKERPALAEVEHAPDRLWVRMDIMQGLVGYDRKPHLDHRRRLATWLLYFSDADALAMVGGDLVLHGADGSARAAIRPRHNRMAAFPCTNESLHSVTPILAQTAPRNFVQVTVSSSVDLWPPLRRSPARHLRGALSRLRRFASAS
jgi:hypothetical protein